jgi:hypothetical protein
MTPHTPGPWTTDALYIYSKGVTIAVVYNATEDVDVSPEQAAADAPFMPPRRTCWRRWRRSWGPLSTSWSVMAQATCVRFTIPSLTAPTPPSPGRGGRRHDPRQLRPLSRL